MARDDWKYVVLDEITETPITYGVVQPGMDDPNGVPFVRGGDIANNLVLIDQLRRISPDISAQYQRTVLRGGEILVSLVGTVGQVALAPDVLRGANIYRQIAMLRPNSTLVDARFLRFFLLSHEGQAAIRGRTLGSVQSVINLRDLKTVEIPLPPLAEQKAIAAVLGALDDKIELNRRMNETLEAMAQAIFKSWYVDFDPVRAKAEGRRPYGMDAETSALFPDGFEDSALGEVPRGWRVGTIDELAYINSWTLKTSDLLDPIYYIEISEVNHGDIANITTYRRGEEPSRARRRLRHGDTVLSTVRPDRGSYFLCVNPTPNQIASTGFAVFTPKTPQWSFVHAALTQPDLFEHLGHQADGGAYPAVRPELIGNWKVVIPGKKEMFDAFHNICAPFYEKSERNRGESSTLGKLRDILLPKLLTGEMYIGQL